MKETIVKINKMKSWFFKKIKLTSLQPDSSRKKEKKRKKKKKKRKASNQQNQKRKRRGYNKQCRNTKNYETIMNNYMAIKCIAWQK